MPPYSCWLLWNTIIVDCHCHQIWSKHNLAILGTWQCGRVKPMCGNGGNIAKVPVTESPSGPGVKPGLPLPLSRRIREAMFRLKTVFRELQQISSGPYRPSQASPLFSKLPSFKCKLDKYRGNSRTSITASASGINYSGLYRYFTVRRIFYRQQRR